MRRREFFEVSAARLGGLLLYSLAGTPKRMQAQSGTVRVPLRFFTAEEARLADAATARIFPSDEAGPGAAEAAVVIYIDRQLAGPYGRDRNRYTQEPFFDGTPEQGYQGKATPREVYREGLKLLPAGFAALPASEQDGALAKIERTRFFQLLRQNTIEGMFCDPVHGGNKDLIGWQLIGFPGPYMSWASEIDAHQGEKFRPKPMSLFQITGHLIKPSEDTE